MAESALSMSLDDIIKTNKTSRGSRRGGAMRNNTRNPRPSSNPYGNSRSGAPSAGSSGKIMISNLDPKVTEHDLRELFKAVGPLKTANLNFDASGRSKGVGTVIFRHSNDAARAIQEYHNRTLDGRPMRIELILNSAAVSALASHAAPAAGAINGAGRGGPRRGGRGGRGGRGRGRGGNDRKPMTAEELDAQMDAYMKDDTMAEAAPMTL